MIKLKISETFLQISFDNFSDHVPKNDWIFLSQTMHIEIKIKFLNSAQLKASKLDFTAP